MYCGGNLVKIGEWGKYPKLRGRGCVFVHRNKGPRSERKFLSQFLNEIHYSLKNIKIMNFVQIGVLICTVAIADSARSQTTRTIV